MQPSTILGNTDLLTPFNLGVGSTSPGQNGASPGIASRSSRSAFAPVGVGGHSLGVNCSLVQHDGTLLTGSRDATVLAWKDGIAVRRYNTHADWVTCLAGVPGWPHFLSGSADHTVALQREDELFYCKRHCGAVKGVVVAGGNQAISAGMDGNVIVSDLIREMETVGIIAKRRPLTCMAKVLVGDSPVVYVGTATGGLYQVDARCRGSAMGDAGVPLDSVSSAHGDTVRALTFVSSTSLVSASSDGLVKLWDTRSLGSGVAASYRVHSDAVWCLCPVPSTNTVLSGGRDGIIVATNLRSHQTSTLVRSAFPTISMAVCNHGGTLVACNTSSDIETFDISGALSEELKTAKRSVALSAVRTSRGALADTSNADVSFLSPSRILIEQREAAPVTDMFEADVGVFESLAIEPSAVPDTDEAREAWCSAAKASWRRHTSPPPDAVLAGRPGFIKCHLLHTRRHVAALSTNGYVYIFDLCRLSCVHSFAPPLSRSGSPDWEAAVKALNESHPAHATSWCAVHCRWGAVCVTLSAEDIANCFMTEWEYHLFAKRILPPHCPSVPGAARMPSICGIPRSKRLVMKGAPPINIGVELLTGLFTADRSGPASPRIVVWSTPNHYSQIDCSAGSVLVSSQDQPGATQGNGSGSPAADDVRVPSWVQLLVSSASPPGPPTNASAVVIKCVAVDPKCPWLPQIANKELSFPRYAPLWDVAAAIAKQAKVNFDAVPTTGSVNAALRAAGQPLLAADTEQGADTTARLVVDEFVQLLAADDVTVMDPLMTIWAAYLAYKEKGSSQLVIKYRVLPACLDIEVGSGRSSGGRR